MTTLLHASLTAALMSRSLDSSNSSTSIAPPTACRTTATFSARLGITSLKPGSTRVFVLIAISSDNSHPRAWSRRFAECPCKGNTPCKAAKTSSRPCAPRLDSGHDGIGAGPSAGRIRPHDHEHRRIVIGGVDEEGIERGLDSSHGLPWIGDMGQASERGRPRADPHHVPHRDHPPAVYLDRLVEVAADLVDLSGRAVHRGHREARHLG